VKATLEERFWSKVNKNGPIPEHCPEIGQCWVWTCSKHTFGYGQFWMGPDAGLKGAHIASWILAHRALPKGAWVLHRCDNPSCVRPSHLFLGTQVDNMQDMHQKGRGHTGAPGSLNHHARLVEDQVVEIRERFAAGESLDALSEEFGVLPKMISRIVTGAAWKHAGGPVRARAHCRTLDRKAAARAA
jgi:hypothetical protein